MKFNVQKETQKKSYFPGSVPCSTTLNFFQPAPVYVQEIVPGSTLHVNMRQFVRTGVLNLPTWGDYKILTKSVFVPFGDVYRPWDSFRSKTKYFGSISFTPTKVPSLTPISVMNALVNTLGYGSANHVSIINVYDASGTVVIPSGTGELSLFSEAVDSYFKISPTWSSDSDVLKNPNSYPRRITKDFYLGKIPRNSFPSGTPEEVLDKYAGLDCYISFSEQAKLLYRVFVALGVPIGNDSVQYSALPLMCYAKALFDLYSPARTDTSAVPFESTALYGLIYKCMGADAVELTTAEVNSLCQMILDNTYYIDNDFQSLLRKQVAVTSQEAVSFPVANNQSSVPVLLTQSTNATYSENQTAFDATHSNVTSDRLKSIFRIGNLIKSNTLIGGKIREFMRSRFGASMSDSHELFEISSDLFDLNISDIFATASTPGDEGSVLGEYGGRALGSGKDSFSFSSDKNGLFFIISVAIQNRNYYDTTQPFARRVNHSDYYNPVFDSLGYEMAPYGYFHNDYSRLTVHGYQSFAYMPRYSDYKFFKPVVSGDFLRRSTSESIMGFIGNAYKTLDDRLHYAYTMEMNKPAFYPALYNTNHIFYEHETPVIIEGGGDDALIDCIYPAVADPLILHTFVKVDYHAPMVGRADVFETSCDDKPDISVTY